MHANTTTAAIRAEPNVTPMIDVMLVLLIIFMSVGPLLATGFHAVPPTGRHLAAHPDDAADVVIGIDGDGLLYLDKRHLSDAAFPARLRERLSARGDDRLVYLRADRNQPYEHVQGVMALATEAGARVVGLVGEAAPPPTPGQT